MTFLSPMRLWLLIGVAVILVAYLVMQRRRKSYSLRFASSELLDSVAPRRPGFRRHIPATAFLLALGVLTVGLAQPARKVQVPRERATVIVAIDTSLSMQATDVEPDRLRAAQAAAHRFVDELPPTLNVGLISFAGSANILVTPSQDREAAHQAIDNLRLAESTAIGEAIFTSLDALLNAQVDETGTLPPSRIVLLSDGQTTVGRPDSAAIEAATKADIPVSTIAFGSSDGFIFYDDPATEATESDVIGVPVEEENLRSIAEQTKGSFFAADSLEELEEVYSNIGSAIGFEEIEREITDWFVGGGLAVLTITAALSLLWFQRLP